jgi:hypothetical protein
MLGHNSSALTPEPFLELKNSRSSPGAVGRALPSCGRNFIASKRVGRKGRARCPQRAGIATAVLDFTVEPKYSEGSGSWEGGIESLQ